MRDITTTTFYHKAQGCLIGSLIGDAIGTPTEGLEYAEIDARFGWVDDFDCDGTDDTVMRDLLAKALLRTGGYATLDDWAQVWLDHWEAIFGPKQAKFFVSVIHTAQKLKRHAVPRMAALGNMPSSSSAMCISPVGIINACNPAQAALQAYNLAGLIHIHDVGFCQDGAAAIAAAVAAAMHPCATVERVLEAAIGAVLPLSGSEMRDRITQTLDLARACGAYPAFRQAVYAQREHFFQRITCDARETVPLALALVLLGQGDVERCVTYAANLGRDADTIGAMCGAVAGALRGVASIREDWLAKARSLSSTDQDGLAQELCAIAQARSERENAARAALAAIL